MRKFFGTMMLIFCVASVALFATVHNNTVTQSTTGASYVTGLIQNQVNSVAVSTGAIQNQLNSETTSVATDTNTLQGQVTTISVSTASLDTNKLNLSGGTLTGPIVLTTATINNIVTLTPISYTPVHVATGTIYFDGTNIRISTGMAGTNSLWGKFTITNP